MSLFMVGVETKARNTHKHTHLFSILSEMWEGKGSKPEASKIMVERDDGSKKYFQNRAIRLDDG